MQVHTHTCGTLISCSIPFLRQKRMLNAIARNGIEHSCVRWMWNAGSRRIAKLGCSTALEPLRFSGVRRNAAAVLVALAKAHKRLGIPDGGRTGIPLRRCRPHVFVLAYPGRGTAIAYQRVASTTTPGRASLPHRRTSLREGQISTSRAHSYRCKLGRSGQPSFAYSRQRWRHP